MGTAAGKEGATKAFDISQSFTSASQLNGNMDAMEIYMPFTSFTKYIKNEYNVEIRLRHSLQLRSRPLFIMTMIAQVYQLKRSSLIGTDQGRTDQTHVLYRPTKTSIYPQLNSPKVQIRTNQTRSFQLVNLCY